MEHPRLNGPRRPRMRGFFGLTSSLTYWCLIHGACGMGQHNQSVTQSSGLCGGEAHIDVAAGRHFPFWYMGILMGTMACCAVLCMSGRRLHDHAPIRPPRVADEWVSAGAGARENVKPPSQDAAMG